MKLQLHGESTVRVAQPKSASGGPADRLDVPDRRRWLVKLPGRLGGVAGGDGERDEDDGEDGVDGDNHQEVRSD